ncbi:MAG TPA: sigma-70 family RNA polymerase sigma factor [Pyrinomonadaceae bacterium]|jgi:RNA polymerase sigma factor (TIGR02999 family)|nr:sigma-70 family RNA polymerase sigma factor [Pyrinomonadaceae bacterium]
MSEITRLLADYTNGNRAVLDELLPLVYNELRRLAHSYLARERQGITLQTTALVHEAYMKLIDQHSVDFKNRSQFFALSAQAMRRILLDSARARIAEKRGSGNKVSLDDAPEASVEINKQLIDLDLALRELAGFDPEQAKIVELRYFGGLTIEETAEVVGSSPATVKREWTMARAWLFDKLR